ncbi:MAG: hypothetical protein ACKORI_09490, partial [Verrucomicrobiota bacterium]
MRPTRPLLLRVLAPMIATALFVALAQAETPHTYGVTEPELRSRTEVNAVLSQAPKPPAEASLRPLTILFAGGAKDHPPQSHSHDVLPKRWKVLLGGAGPGEEPISNM